MNAQTDPKPKKRRTDETATMSFGDHLDDLRRRLILAIVGLVPIFVVALVFADEVLEFLLLPLQEQLRAKDLPQIIQATGPIETFGAYVRVAFVLTIIVGGPWVMWQFWLFVRPGLRHHERRFAHVLIPMSVALSGAGVAFMYFVLLPVVLAFFIGFGSKIGVQAVAVQPLPPGIVLPVVPLLDADPESPAIGAQWINLTLREYRVCVGMVEGEPIVLGSPLKRHSGIAQQYRVSEYVKLVFQLALAFTLGFQTPIVVMLLAWSRLVPISFMARNRKYVLMICAIAGAVLTPADPISMILLAAPLYLLYEFGMVLARFLTPERIARGFGRGDAGQT